jgi:hypothetical protein
MAENTSSFLLTDKLFLLDYDTHTYTLGRRSGVVVWKSMARAGKLLKAILDQHNRAQLQSSVQERSRGIQWMQSTSIRVWLAMGRVAMNKKRWESMGWRRWSVTDPSSVAGHKEISIDKANQHSSIPGLP